MKPYQEMLEGGYRLIRIRNLRRLILLFIFFLTIIGWAYIWWANGAGLKPLYTPLDAAFPWLLVMLLIIIAMGIVFRDMEINYAKRDGQKYLMAQNSQRRAIWTIIIAATLTVALVIPPTGDFASSQLSFVRSGQVSSGQVAFIADFSNEDFLGLTKVDSLTIKNDASSLGVMTVVVLKEGTNVLQQTLGPGNDISITIYDQGDALHMYNATLTVFSGSWVRYEVKAHVILASTLVVTIPLIMIVYIVVSATFFIRLRPVRKKFASASIYSFDYSQEVDRGEQVFSKYDVRGKAEGVSEEGALPPPPEMTEGLPPPPVPAAGIPPAPQDGIPPPPGIVPQPHRAGAQEPAREFDIFVEDGSKCFTNADYDGALRNFDSALSIEPGNITAMLARGTVLLKLDREKDALDTFNRVLAVESTNEKALHSKARILVDLRQWGEAVRILDSYLQMKPVDVEALGWKGDALMALGRRNEAALAYETALNLQPNDADLNTKLERARLDVASIMSRAMVSTASGNYDGALALYEEILRYEPSNTRALAGKAGVLRRLGRKEESIASLDAVLAIEPENPGALLERAKMHLEEGHLTEALESAEKLVKVSPADVRGIVLKGDALAEMDRFEESRAAYKQALAVELDNPEAKTRLDRLDARLAGIAQGLLSRELDDVKGIGPAKVKALYESGFKTIEDLRKADADQLVNVKGISKKIAEDIVQHFKVPSGSSESQPPPPV